MHWPWRPAPLPSLRCCDAAWHSRTWEGRLVTNVQQAVQMEGGPWQKSFVMVLQAVKMMRTGRAAAGGGASPSGTRTWRKRRGRRRERLQPWPQVRRQSTWGQVAAPASPSPSPFCSASTQGVHYQVHTPCLITPADPAWPRQTSYAPL